MKKELPLFFKRGKGPLVSLFISTRRRTQHLIRSIDSCHSLAKDPSLLEYIVKVDEDDEESLREIEWLKKIVPIKVINTSRGRGYLDMGDWHNIMAEVAKGDWLWIFNDDFRIKTQNWDQLLLETAVSSAWHAGTSDVFLLIPETNGNPYSNESVIVRRTAYKILGHVTKSPYTDSWLYFVFQLIHSSSRVPYIQIIHEREEEDPLKKETGNAFAFGISTLIGFEAIRAQIEDSTKLLAHIENRHNQGNWKEKPDAPGWWFCEQEKPLPGKYVLVIDDGKILDLGANGFELFNSYTENNRWIAPW